MTIENTQYIDSEFSLSGNEKIDYKQILMKQIDLIRFLRTQDMGEHIILKINVDVTDKQGLFWLQNSSKYQNSIKAYKSLLITYEDEEFDKNIKIIETKYINLFRLERKKLMIESRKKGLNNTQYGKEEVELKRRFAFANTTQEYDEIFEQCLLKTKRAKFIGGNDIIKE